MIFAIFGILSGLLVIVADIPYIRNALMGKTQPHRVTWFIVFVLNVISIGNQAASGATNSLWLAVGGTIATFSVFIVSLDKGTGGYEKLDLLVLAGALLGLLLWWQLNSPLVSILANMAVASLAVAPTYKKAYLKPASETKITWLIGTISAACAIISVGKIDYILLLLPMYSFFVQLGLFLVLEARTPN